MKFILKFFAVILTLFISSPTTEIATYTTSQENPELVFSVMSDTHIEGNNKERFELFSEGIRDVNTAEKNDALIFLGDDTMNGQVVELSIFHGLLKKYNQIENVLMVAGNHDLCPSDHNVGKYHNLQKRFIRYNNAFLENEIENLYYSQVIEGYHFIVLGSESDAGVQQDISDEQFQWLENELKTAEESGKPVFIFNHWPLNHTFQGVWDGGHLGEDSERLNTLFKECNNKIVYFSGHLHMGLYDEKVSYESEDNIAYISVPAFGSDNNIGDADIQDKGMGLYVETYDNEIVVRIRNFAEHKWMNIEYRVSL